MIWILGAKGMLGTELVEILRAQNTPILTSDAEVSILSIEELESFAQGKSIDWIINCAAYTAVDKAEDDIDFCWALNEQGPKNIAQLAKHCGARLFHLSTDYVFDGSSANPLTEDAPTAPIGIYGKSKLAGEEAIREKLAEHVIIRTAWLYGKYGNNFVATMLRLMSEKEELGVIADQIGSPTSARDLALAIAHIIGSENAAFGTYHYSNQGKISWYEFALAIQKHGLEMGILSKKIPIKPLRTHEYPTRAKRPAYSLLDKTKIMNTFNLDIPDWERSLVEYMGEIKR